MSTLKEESNAFMADPAHAVRVSFTYLLVQAVGSVLAAGASVEDLRECFEEAITLSEKMLAEQSLRDTFGKSV